MTSPPPPAPALRRARPRPSRARRSRHASAATPSAQEQLAQSNRDRDRHLSSTAHLHAQPLDDYLAYLDSLAARPVHHPRRPPHSHEHAELPDAAMDLAAARVLACLEVLSAGPSPLSLSSLSRGVHDGLSAAVVAANSRQLQQRQARTAATIRKLTHAANTYATSFLFAVYLVDRLRLLRSAPPSGNHLQPVLDAPSPEPLLVLRSPFAPMLAPVGNGTGSGPVSSPLMSVSLPLHFFGPPERTPSPLYLPLPSARISPLDGSADGSSRGGGRGLHHPPRDTGGAHHRSRSLSRSSARRRPRSSDTLHLYSSSSSPVPGSMPNLSADSPLMASAETVPPLPALPRLETGGRLMHRGSMPLLLSQPQHPGASRSVPTTPTRTSSLDALLLPPPPLPRPTSAPHTHSNQSMAPSPLPATVPVDLIVPAPPTPWPYPAASLFLAALVVAEKILHDQVYRSADWALFAGPGSGALPPATPDVPPLVALARIEAAFLARIGFQLAVPPPATWRAWVESVQLSIVKSRLAVVGAVPSFFDMAVVASAVPGIVAAEEATAAAFKGMAMVGVVIGWFVIVASYGIA
ncbi:hypothetical protein BC828DRAFT_404632 [Blastocladiella britannica]|nr:hypothetical protein BC828DRAFT_404632 [Blastocladiella britannica]